VFVNGGAKVVIADVMATNGVVHVVDSVLLPSSLLNARNEINSAIREGAAWFNNGDIEGSFVRYMATALALSKTLRAAPINKALEEGSKKDFTAGAFTLRGEFDRFTAVPTSGTSAGSQSMLQQQVFGEVTAPTRRTIRADEMSWDVTNDSVMGGISDSRVTLRRQGTNVDAVFAGTATTASNGGFANSYARLNNGPVDFSGCTGLTVMLKGDGQRYVFELRDSGNNMGVSYEVDVFPTSNWQAYDIPFSMLEAEKPFWASRNTASVPDLDRSNIVSMGIKRSAFLKGYAKDPSFTNGAFEVSFREMKCY
jgi:hypothetical protein